MKKRHDINKPVSQLSAKKMKLYRRIRSLLVGIIIISTINMIFSLALYTPKLHYLTESREGLYVKYNILQDKIAAAQSQVGEIWLRDSEIYRTIYGVSTLQIPQVEAPYPAYRYDDLMGWGDSPIMLSTWSSMDDLAKNIYRGSLSLDEVDSYIYNFESLSMATPAIWPIDRHNLRNNIGAFGMRLHPIYKRYIEHKGVDLACSTGDPIYSTADGIIEIASLGQLRVGYGQMVLINHGYGYKTRYAHLSRIDVKVGTRVKRGETIGLAGNTGGSTGPHLHYEVIHNGKVVNPINYFDRYMTNDEYSNIMKRLTDANYEIVEE